MKLFLLILGIVVLALNLFLWYSKKKKDARQAEKSEASDPNSYDFLNSPKAAALKEEAAAELGIAVEQLNNMSPDEIVDLATEKGLIQAR